MHGTVHLFERLPQVARPAAPLGRAAAPARAVPLIGVIRNLRSHRQAPLVPEWSGRASLLVETPEERSELQDVLARFAEQRVDYLVVAGGDGTVRDVLTCGEGYFGDSWPPVIIVPSGKTNALAVDLGLPAHWTLEQALEAIASGRIEQRWPLVVSQLDDPDARVQGFVFGAGAYAGAIQLGQRAHDKGAFNNLAVGATAIWAFLQTVFGSAHNVWRRGTAMRLFDAQGRELPHSGFGQPELRHLMFASTLGRFPAGLRPFGKDGEGLRAAIIDSTHLGLFMRLPLLFRGIVSKRMRHFGFHLLQADGLQIELAEQFILDGEAFPAGRYRLSLGPKLRFVVP
jgi:diacylglycerol kinase family enzyme